MTKLHISLVFFKLNQLIEYIYSYSHPNNNLNSDHFESDVYNLHNHRAYMHTQDIMTSFLMNA